MDSAEAASAVAGLELVGVKKAFGGTTVLDGMDLAVAPGEFVSLIGPSGCGKTTTLNIVAGFENPDQGEVWLGGSKITGLPSHRRGLGMVFQSHALFPHMTVAENIGFGLRMRKVADAEINRRVGRALEMVRLSGFEGRHPRQLSGGQQQRVGLARALAVQPKVILLDEPLSSLDAQLRRDMKSEVRRILKAVSTTSVYVTHDQEEALTMSDRIVLMNKGRIEQAGTPEEVYTHPVSEFATAFIGQASFLDGQVLDARSGRVAFGPAGTAVIRADLARRDGDRIRLAVRPDRVGVSPQADDGTLTGTLITRTFVGPILHCEIGMADGAALLAHVPAKAPLLTKPGDTVAIRVDPADWLVLEPGPQ